MRYDDHLNTLYREAERHFTPQIARHYDKRELYEKWQKVLESAYEYGRASGKTEMYGERALRTEEPTKGDGEWL